MIADPYIWECFLDVRYSFSFWFPQLCILIDCRSILLLLFGFVWIFLFVFNADVICFIHLLVFLSFNTFWEKVPLPPFLPMLLHHCSASHPLLISYPSERNRPSKVINWTQHNKLEVRLGTNTHIKVGWGILVGGNGKKSHKYPYAHC